MSFFFFSSRRRHTRSLRDWSSDVCSSDLVQLLADLVRYLRGGEHRDEAVDSDAVEAEFLERGHVRQRDRAARPGDGERGHHALLDHRMRLGHWPDMDVGM